MKGIFSIDTFMALLLMLFAVVLMQGMVGLSFDNSNSFGASFEAKAESIRLGSIMNTFYSTNPGANDYVQINSSPARAFKDSAANFTASRPVSNAINVTLINRHFNRSYAYSTAGVAFNTVTWRITK